MFFNNKNKYLISNMLLWLTIGITGGCFIGYFYRIYFLSEWYVGFTHTDMTLLIAILFLSFATLLRFKT